MRGITLAAGPLDRNNRPANAYDADLASFSISAVSAVSSFFSSFSAFFIACSILVPMSATPTTWGSCTAT